MNLESALKELAAFYNLDANDLIDYAAEDEIGGFHTDPDQKKWIVGSVWGVEGQVLYALTRAIKPSVVFEFGTAHGCSAAHISAALVKNRGKGRLICVDRSGDRRIRENFTAAQLRRTEPVVGEVMAFIETADFSDVGLIFDDAFHDHDGEAGLWKALAEKVEPGTFIVSHDVAHDTVGTPTAEGIIEAVGMNWLKLRIDPADCGLGIWRS